MKMGERSSILQFQIQILRKEMEDYKQEICQQEDKKKNLIKRLEQLKEEQSGHMCELRKQIREKEKILDQKEQWSKEQVEHTVKENIMLKHNHEEELEELHCKLARLQVQEEVLQAEKEPWLLYKSEGMLENQQKIEKLEKDIADSQRIFQEMSEYYQRSHALAIEDIDRKTAQQSEEIKQQSLKKVKENVGRRNEMELKENDRLKQEVDVYFKKISELESNVWKLEMENLEHVDKLLSATPGDPQNSLMKAFHAPTASIGSPDIPSVSESIMQIIGETSPESADRPPCSIRPLKESEGAQEERDETPDTSQDHSEILSSSEYDFMGGIHVLPLKQKLCVIGTAAPLHHQPPLTDASLGPSTVTTQAIQSKVQQSHTSTLQSGRSDES
ncbi:coiled-coil domain-containing protein 83 isoform X1 [Misgurnus anguillicaudatus]|uniref:coiled-coil domain-containing protein 83 isoform X1 n=2 Tax=Misgurnus anguillicaudatus TaxID=75329 RepID=UPI003CCF7D8D